MSGPGYRQALWRWGPPIVWMAVIGFASTEAFAASETSRFIGPALRWLLPGAGAATIEHLHGVIRKLGHVTEFGLLALLWYRAFGWGSPSWSRSAAVRALAVTLLCGGLDETHQLFVPRRTASLLDIGIDALGGGGILGVGWLRSGWRRNGRSAR
jgi:VanZ family protein